MKFENSRYAKFWGSKAAQDALRVFVNNPDIFSSNYDFWKGQFEVDPKIIERGSDGVALFMAKLIDRTPGRLLDMRAPLGDANQADKSGIEAWTGSIPDFIAAGYVETALEREHKKRMFDELFGRDSELLLAYANDIQKMLDGANQTMSNMAAQMLSKGEIIYDAGRGIKGNVLKAPIPDANRRKAGAVAWSDTANCKLIDQLAEIETKFRMDNGLEGAALKWQIPFEMYRNIFLKNAQVIEYIKNWRKANDKGWAESMPINSKMFEEVFSDNELFSPIEIIREKQRDVEKTISGWKAGTAVLRPEGYAGSVKRADVLDIKLHKDYGSTSIEKVFADRDIFTIINTTLDNGNFKEWHTDLVVAAVPVLEEWTNHLLVDTTTAD